MSKLIIDLFDEIKSLDIVEDDFELFVMSIEIDESGEVSEDASVEAVTHIEIDSEHEECLLHTSSKPNSDSKAISIGKALEELKAVEPGYLLCSKVKESVDTVKDTNSNSNTGTGNPIIGFGENIELKRFFVVCEAFEDNAVLH